MQRPFILDIVGGQLQKIEATYHADILNINSCKKKKNKIAQEITVKTGGGEQGSGLVRQVTVECRAQPEDVYGFLLRAVKEVVLDGPGHRASAIFQLPRLQSQTRQFQPHLVSKDR